MTVPGLKSFENFGEKYFPTVFRSLRCNIQLIFYTDRRIFKLKTISGKLVKESGLLTLISLRIPIS
jgi:hypothetical protein